MSHHQDLRLPTIFYSRSNANPEWSSSKGSNTTSCLPCLAEVLTYLRQLVQEIEAQAISSQREINIVKTVVAAKQRDVRLLELTSSEVKQLSKITKVYEGAGKMYVLPAAHVAISRHVSWLWYSLGLDLNWWCTSWGCSHRFVLSPTSDVEKRLASDTTVLKSDISNLNKKLHYLETTHKNSREHIEQIFKSGGRAWEFSLVCVGHKH